MAYGDVMVRGDAMGYRDAVTRDTSLDDEFEQFFERYYPRVSGFFIRRGFSADESEDLAQRTFLKAYRSWERHHRRYRLEKPASGTAEWEHYRRNADLQELETGWIFTIALNTYRNEIRCLSTQKRSAFVKDLDQMEEHGWEPVAENSDPEVEYLGKQRARQLAKVLDELPPGMRRCFELRAQGLKYKDVAKIMKISIQSVKSQLHQARRRLEDLLAGQ